jgi:hypothetical protein
VAILARWTPVVTRLDLPGDASDGQCRYIEAAINGVLIASVYAPNGNPQPGRTAPILLHAARPWPTAISTNPPRTQLTQSSAGERAENTGIPRRRHHEEHLPLTD